MDSSDAVFACFACLAVGFLFGYLIRGIVYRANEHLHRKASR